MERQWQRGKVDWAFKMRVRREVAWTHSERHLWRVLQRALRGRVRTQWWLLGTDYRVGFFIPSIDLAVEVDGPSHIGREGADRYRSRDIRDCRYDVARVTIEDVLGDAERILAHLRYRIETQAAESDQVEAA